MNRNSWPTRPQYPDITCPTCGVSVVEEDACWGFCPDCFEARDGFEDEPNVRSVIFKLADGDERRAQDAMDRIAQILGLNGWQGTKMFGRYEIGEGIGEQ